MSHSHTLRQPVYRRPSWAQRDKSYEYYMRKDIGVDRSPGHDFGMENFSYDEAHLCKWQMPKALETRLSQQLRDPVVDWQYAGAAVCTALDRINKLDDDSLHRGYPEKAHHHLSRRVSNQSYATTGAGMDTPPLSSPISPTPIALKASLLGSEKLTPLDTISQRKSPGMDTPPFTPVDSQACPTPEVHGDTPAASSPVPDVLHLTCQLSPLSMSGTRSDSFTGDASVSGDPKIMTSFSSAAPTTSSTPSLAVFDENAWETFVNTYKAELLDVRSDCWVRFKGCGYTVDKLRIETSMEKEWKEVVEEFNVWWASMKPLVAKYEEKVKMLEVPTMELMQMERMAKGLHI